MFMHLDVMVTKEFILKEGDKFAMVLAPTLNLDGTPDTGYYTPVITMELTTLIIDQLSVYVFSLHEELVLNLIGALFLNY